MPSGSQQPNPLRTGLARVITEDRLHEHTRKTSHLGALRLLARDKVLALVGLIKHEAPFEVWATHPVNDLLQPAAALDTGDEGRVGPADRNAYVIASRRVVVADGSARTTACYDDDSD